MSLRLSIGIGLAAVISGVLAALVLRLAWPPPASLARVEARVRLAFPEVRELTTRQLAAWLADPRRPPPVLLDARTAAEFDVSHLPRAVRELPSSGVAPGTPVVVYCSVGWRSAERARQLNRAGFTNVFNLEGSIFAWAIENRPLEADGQPARKVHPFDANWGRLLPDSLRSDKP